MLGPSINDVSFKGEGGWCQKWHFEAIFRAKTGVTREGGGLEIQNQRRCRLWMFPKVTPLLGLLSLRAELTPYLIYIS